MTYRVIYADPPWSYKDKSLRFGASRREGDAAAQAQYQTMSLDDLKRLEIPAADNAYLFMWVTNPLIEQGFELVKAWGFTYKTMLTWVKPSIRLGYYFRGRTEHVLFATKGKPGRLKRRDLGNVLEAPVGRHSAKPLIFYDIIEEACDGPYLEMFARVKHPGWDAWGNEIDSDVLIKEKGTSDE